MVLDISLLRKHPELVRESQRNRFKDVNLVDKVIAIDEQWKQERFHGDNLNKVKNMCSKLVGKKIKNKEQSGDSEVGIPDQIVKSLGNLQESVIADFSIAQIKNLILVINDAILTSQQSLTILEEQRKKMLFEIGNILDKNVIVSNNEDNNGLIRVFGDTTTTKRYSHVDLVEMIGGVNLKMGRKNFGNRGYYLMNSLVNLETAIITFATHLLMEKNYSGVSPPVIMNKESMQLVAQLNQFHQELYKVVCKRSEDDATDEGEETKYLIATAEQPIAALNADRWIPKSELPIRYYGVSECFRQEVGSHGRDTRGIFRVHQFKKIEQFCITSPHDGESERMFDEMIGNAEEFYQQLGIPYRVVSIVSGELNNAAAIKYDLEGWFPGSEAFRELVSCSNCTDYQARSVLTRYGETKAMNQDTEYVHMLNCTMSATTRTMCAILENYQTDEGIVVPEVLRPFMFKAHREFIPFIQKN